MAAVICGSIMKRSRRKKLHVHITTKKQESHQFFFLSSANHLFFSFASDFFFYFLEFRQNNSDKTIFFRLTNFLTTLKQNWKTKSTKTKLTTHLTLQPPSLTDVVQRLLRPWSRRRWGSRHTTGRASSQGPPPPRFRFQGPIVVQGMRRVFLADSWARHHLSPQKFHCCNSAE